MLIHGPQGARFVGLHPDVRYRIEIGFAFVDDGQKLFKMRLSPFQTAIGTGGPPDAPLDAEATELVLAYPTVFALLETEAEAASSVAGKET